VKSGARMNKSYMEDHEREAMVDSIRCRREDRGQEPTAFKAPDKDQKWRARELFGFMWRHLGMKIPPGYRDVMLLLIEKANAATGQLNWRQGKMAELTLLGRQYINEACQWWAEETPFLRIDRRKNKDGRFVSNAYHVRWRAIEKAWADVIAHVGILPTGDENVTRPVHVVCNPTTHVAPYPTTVVASDTTTRNSKGKCKEETHHEMAHPPSACDAHDFLEGFFDGETQPLSELVESQKEASKEEQIAITPKGLTAAERLSRRYGVIFWTDAMKAAETELKRCTLPKRRKELEDKIADCHNRLEGFQHEQRDETAAGTS
jgi:hypothetical protein